jgi:hypothetical protein
MPPTLAITNMAMMPIEHRLKARRRPRGQSFLVSEICRQG